MEFQGFPKISRLSRECIITEKIDGTNAQIYIEPVPDPYIPEKGIYSDCGMIMRVGSRTRFLTLEDDNHGFCNWAFEHGIELIMGLGPGRHYGEWWGKGIQRNYGLKTKKFSLFNVIRWCLPWEIPKQIPKEDPRIIKMQDVLPKCCGLVPVLWRGIFNTNEVDISLDMLKKYGSKAAPGFMKPEGVVVYHIPGNVGFKKTIEKDEEPKSKKEKS